MRLLYDFKEPFDRDKAMEKGWRYGGEAKLDIQKLVYFYKVHFDLLFDILEVVLTPYIGRSHELVKPDPMVVSDFSIMLNSFYLIQNHWEFRLRKVYFVDFSSFDPIDGNYERLIDDWAKLRGEFLDHKAKISNICHLNALEYKIPYRLERFTKAIKHNLSKQKEYQQVSKPQFKTTTFPSDFKWNESDSRIFHFGKRGSVSFTAKRSKRLMVFKMIVEGRGEPIRVGLIARRIQRDVHYVYSVLRNLRKIIYDTKIESVFLVQDKGSVYIAFSPSKSVKSIS